MMKIKCTKHIAFYSKNKFEKLVYLFGFITRIVFLMMNIKCPKHVEFYSKNKFEKLVDIVGFIIRIVFLMINIKCTKHVEFYSKNKFEKLVYLFGFITRIVLLMMNIKCPKHAEDTKNLIKTLILLVYITQEINKSSVLMSVFSCTLRDYIVKGAGPSSPAV